MLSARLLFFVRVDLKSRVACPPSLLLLLILLGHLSSSYGWHTKGSRGPYFHRGGDAHSDYDWPEDFRQP